MKKLQLSPVTFQLINGPISGGNTFLKDSYGYTYSVKVDLYSIFLFVSY